MMLAALLGGFALAMVYGLALCRAAARGEGDEMARPTQIHHRWVVRPRQWSVLAPTRQTVAIRPQRRR